MRIVSLIGLVYSLVAAASSPAHAADFQPPEIRAPERGSLAGEYAGIAFDAADLSRGEFSLAGPFQAPAERGAIGANVFPGYSPHAGISEFGVGWTTQLEIHRFRVSGDLDYTTDDLLSPWGRLIRGTDTDGDFYPAGLSQLVRVREVGGDMVAHLPDGTRWTFSGSIGAATAKGTYSWYLSDVVTLTGGSTHLTWIKGVGRSYLDSVEYGGIDAEHRQYRISLQYLLHDDPRRLFVSYASGAESTLDRRVATITISAKSASTDAWAERWRYTLSYDDDHWGPAFYLREIVQTFASGESAPAARYAYNAAADWLGAAAFSPVPALQPVLAQLGDDAIQHDRSTLFDVDEDGRIDLESAATQTLARMTDAGYVLQPLPPPEGGGEPFGGCRPPASRDNLPRTLVKMSAGDGEVRTLALFPDGGRQSSTAFVCSFTGALLSQETLEGDWELGPLVRLADLNRDHQPDLVRVGFGYYAVAPNGSGTGRAQFEAPRFGLLSPAFEPVAAWVYDFNGDGLPDLVARDSSNIVVWFGKGDFQFTEEGLVFVVQSQFGAVSDLNGYDLERRSV